MILLTIFQARWITFGCTTAKLYQAVYTQTSPAMITPIKRHDQINAAERGLAYNTTPLQRLQFLAKSPTAAHETLNQAASFEHISSSKGISYYQN